MNPMCLGIAVSMMCLGLVRGAESVYVSNFIEGTVVRIGADGTKTILGKDLGYPAGIAADRAGRIFVASGNTNRVRILTGEGSGQTFGSAPVRAGYTAMAFDASGRLFIANEYHSGIVVMSPDGGGQLLVGGVNLPFGLAFDASGILHVAHMDTQRLRGLVSQVLPGGGLKQVVSDLRLPAGIAFDAEGSLFVAENMLGNVWKIAPDGSRRVFASGLKNPLGLAFSGKGGLLVAENGSGTVIEIAASGERTTRATGLYSPMYLAVADDDPLSVEIAHPEASKDTVRLTLKASPLSYHEIFHSLDFSVWNSVGRFQILGGNRLEVSVPMEHGESRGFFGVVPR